MAQARVVILNEAKKGKADEWALCFQWCRYEYGDGSEENGYRFIYRKPNSGHLQGARGQARIPTIADILELIGIAIREGWGHHIASGDGYQEIEE